MDAYKQKTVFLQVKLEMEKLNEPGNGIICWEGSKLVCELRLNERSLSRVLQAHSLSAVCVQCCAVQTTGKLKAQCCM